jgi:hypothetical protein
MPKKAENELAPVDDVQVVGRYFRYAIELREPVSCFQGDGAVNFLARTVSFDPTSRHLELEIPESVFGRLSKWDFAHLDRPLGKIRLSYSVNEVTFFVHAVLQGRTERRLSLHVDLPVFKLQRREALRIKVLESHKASVKLTDNLDLPIHDISAGGLGLVVTEMQKDQIQAEGGFPKAVLSFAGKDYTVSLELKTLGPTGRGDLMWKVGLNFHNLPATVEQTIAREAYLHTHKIWSRWL